MEVCKGDRSAFSPPKDRLVSCLIYKEGNKGSWRGRWLEEKIRFDFPKFILPFYHLERKSRSTLVFGLYYNLPSLSPNSWMPGIHGNSFYLLPYLRPPTVSTFPPPPGEIALLEGLTVVYKSSIDLYFYVIGSSYENEVRIPIALCYC